MNDGRRSELAQGLARARARIDAACAAAGRRADEVDLLVVTKTFPASDVDLLADLGCTDVGESRDQEARAKRDEVASTVRWHMIGQVQRRKARHVASWADVVESVDRAELVTALDGGADALDRRLDVLLQVSLDPVERPGRGGARPDALPSLVEAVLASARLRLRGLMAVAPLDEDPEAAFARLQGVHAEVLRLAPMATMLSAGMSGDLEAAIAHGATQVRIGGAILGNRPPLK